MALNDFDPLSATNGVFGAEAATGPRNYAEPQKVHHSYIWLGSARIFLLVMFVALATNVSTLMDLADWASEKGGSGLIIGLITLVSAVVILALIAGLRYLGYKNLSYVLDDQEFNVYSGVITKRHVHVPYQRIQAIDENSSLLQRLVGVCSLKIDTAGGAANKGVILEYLLKADGQALRNELFARKQRQLAGLPVTAEAAAAAVAAGANAPGVAAAGAAGTGAYAAAAAAPAYTEAPVTFAFGLSNKELILSGISNSGVAGGAIVVALTVFFTGALIAIPDMAVDGINSLTKIAAVLSLLGGLGMALVTWALGALGTCLQFGGFSAKRQGTRIEVQRGVLQRVYQGVDIDRVQSIIVKQGFIRRLMGYAEVSLGKIESNASDSGSQNKNTSGIMVHPFVKVSEVAAVIAGLVPEYSWVPEPQRPVAPVAKRRMFVRKLTWGGAGFWLALSLLIIQLILLATAGASLSAAEATALNSFFIVGYIICALMAAVSVFSGILWFKESRYAYDGRGLMIRNGGLNTTTVVIPKNKLQFASLHSTPFQRMAQVRTIAARTAAGIGGTTVALRDIALPEAEAWLSWTQPIGSGKRSMIAEPAPEAPAEYVVETVEE